MKTVCKKLLSLVLVAMLLVSAVPFQAFATEGETVPVETAAAETVAETTAATEAAVVEAPVETTAATEAPVETTAATEAPVEETTAATEAPVEETTAATEAPAEETTAATEAPVEETTEATESVIEDETDNKANNSNASGARVSIYLDPQGGSVSSFTHSVVVGQTYNYVSSLPTPKREHYNFTGWNRFTMNGYVPVDDNSTVVDTAPLYATWALKNYTVEFQRHDGNQWVGVKTVKVPAVSLLTTANGFPTDTEISNNFKLAGYSIVGWEIGESDVAFYAGATYVTGNIIVRPRYQRSVTLMANNPADYTSSSYKTITVEIGEPVPALPNPGARDGYTFTQWVSQDKSVLISNKANLSNVNAHPIYTPALGTTFHAEWTGSTVVYLYIHTNGNTQTATKIVPYYEAPSSGTFNTKLINMYSIFPNYGDFDDSNDTAYGWYSASQWKNYCANTAANPATSYVDVGSNLDYCELHIMLINGGTSSNVNNNSYNTNTNTADKTNPTTGDYIMMAVTVMAISAAALACLFFLKKRKAAK